jgi:uncharacterized protein YndB with AHSA1/START domain
MNMAVESNEKGNAAGQPAAPKKKSILMPILLTLAAIIVGLLIVIAMQPAEFRVERSATIPAPPEEVFAQVNDFHAWKEWSPWAKLDPQSKETYEGSEAGTGAIFKWSGNNEVGEGMMTVTDSQPNELIRIKLDFIRPFAATNTAEFTFKPEGDQTRVTWSMFGQNTFMGKAIHLVMDMDKMVGGNFEQGLAQMKSAVEAKHAK